MQKKESKLYIVWIAIYEVFSLVVDIIFLQSVFIGINSWIIANLFYMLIPFIVRVNTIGRINYEKGKKLCMNISIWAYIIIIVYAFLNPGSVSGWIVPLIYYEINMSIFVEKKPDKKQNSITSEVEQKIESDEEQEDNDLKLDDIDLKVSDSIEKEEKDTKNETLINPEKKWMGVVFKTLIFILLLISMPILLFWLLYKPVYSVSIDGAFMGYVSSKNDLDNSIKDYLQEADSDRVGYVLLNTRPEYDFSIVKREVVTKDEEILASIRNSWEIYYRVYAVNVNEKEECCVESLQDAQAIVDKVNAAQKSYTKKAAVMISEKFEKEYDAVTDIDLVANEIIKKIKAENKIFK